MSKTKDSAPHDGRLERLTESTVRSAEAIGKHAGWYSLCYQGYLPAEVAMFNEQCMSASDIAVAVRAHAERRELPIPSTCAIKRQRVRPEPPSDWRSAFRDTVMRTGMVLSLTQPMLQFLCAVADGVRWDRGAGNSTIARPDNWIASEVSLTKRGLIRRRQSNWQQELREASTLDAQAQEDFMRRSNCELTEAGEAVVALLKCTGVFVESDAAIERRTRGAAGA